MKIRRSDRVELKDSRQGRVIEISGDTYEILLRDGGMVTVSADGIAYRLVSNCRVCPICGAEKSPSDEGCPECLKKADQLAAEERKW